MDKNTLSELHELVSSGHVDAIDKLIEYYLSINDNKNAFFLAQRYEFFSYAKGYRTLGYFYQKGIGTNPSIEKAKKYYQKSFDLGDVIAGYNLATILIKDREVDKSLIYLASGVENNHFPSYRLLANLYLNGDGVEKNVDIAINLLTRVIELGDDKSIDSLATIYYKNKDYESALKYFQKGADNSDLDCLYHLALCYAKGLGTKQDFNKAIKYYQIGANLLEPRCLYNLSLYYRNGTYIEENIELANKLERQAFENGFKK